MMLIKDQDYMEWYGAGAEKSEAPRFCSRKRNLLGNKTKGGGRGEVWDKRNW